MVDLLRVPALRGDHLLQLLQGFAAIDLRSQHGMCFFFIGSFAAENQHMRGQDQANFLQIRRAFPSQRRDGFLDLQRIADRVA
ncbi:hypothetical protein D3C73_1548710 [compost metagenome]